MSAPIKKYFVIIKINKINHFLKMDKNDIKSSSPNFNKNNNKNDNITCMINSKIITIFDFKKDEPNSNQTLLDLKEYIKTKFHFQDYEYELYIGENSINHFPNDINILYLLNEYNDNKFIIKSFKNIFDINNEINKYDTFLTNNISLKEDEINLLNEEYKSMLEDLRNV